MSAHAFGRQSTALHEETRAAPGEGLGAAQTASGAIGEAAAEEQVAFSIRRLTHPKH